MNTELASACKCYGLYDDDKIIGFAGVLHQPHGHYLKLKRCSRLVILPDYQGIGLGYKFLNIIAEFYVKQGYDFSIVTSAKNFIMKLQSSEKWKMIRLNRSRCVSQKSKIDCNRTSMRNLNKTAGFMYKK